ncbi:hypothetical protein SCHPADRAFT_901018 [Schizopora paradoxa]|uniref:Pal1-domain-containing protein n=1 Tax=Schizopora paradoxa TaxID=27342 RepID=A0A0H2S5Y7_9AGAM|nr:hypothetical protein SCHPADRAFT_901018 [Schizopora paradoxa]
MPTTTSTATTTTSPQRSRTQQQHHYQHPPSSSSRPVHARHRSASDPFLDVYTAPSVPYVETRQARSNTIPHAPPVPPKASAKKPRQYPDPRDHPRMLEAAVRDSVTVRPSEAAPRTRMGRSMTSAPTGAQPKAPPATSRRSYSQDSVTQVAAAVDKARTAKNSKANAGTKKGSAHADVIDSLDPSSYGGPMFHHDGPFDACAPSRNKHKNRAPMLAWATQKEEREPTSAANFREQRRLAAIDNNNHSNNISNFGGSNSDSPYGAVSAFAASMDNYPSKNQVDRIAEAWGMHEPEPYEEFFGGGGGGGNESAASSVKGGIEGRDGRYRRARDHRQDHGEEGRPAQTRRPTVRGNIPPPQPIFVPGVTEDVGQISPSMPSPGAPGQPKRSKSIMQKFRRLRESPNVPMGGDYEDDRDGSPPSSVENYQQDGAGALSDGGVRASRPTHRHNNSFFGRFGRGGNNAGSKSADEYSPTHEQFAYVERSGANRGKDLPPRPPGVTPEPYYEKDDYFSGPVSPGSPNTPGNGLGRKTSLLKKVKGVVRATNK